jgi:predicted small secreted protein
MKGVPLSMKRKPLLSLLLLSSMLLAGCAAMAVGVTAVGVGSGTYMYINGDMNTDYYASFDKVWAACEKTVADMRGVEVQPVKEIGKGVITTLINEEKVQFSVKYKAKDVTTVGVRVGLLGDKLSSQLIHDKIGDHLSKN